MRAAALGALVVLVLGLAAPAPVTRDALGSASPVVSAPRSAADPGERRSAASRTRAALASAQEAVAAAGSGAAEAVARLADAVAAPWTSSRAG